MFEIYIIFKCFLQENTTTVNINNIGANISGDAPTRQTQTQLPVYQTNSTKIQIFTINITEIHIFQVPGRNWNWNWNWNWAFGNTYTRVCINSTEKKKKKKKKIALRSIQTASRLSYISPTYRYQIVIQIYSFHFFFFFFFFLKCPGSTFMTRNWSICTSEITDTHLNLPLPHPPHTHKKRKKKLWDRVPVFLSKTTFLIAGDIKTQTTMHLETLLLGLQSSAFLTFLAWKCEINRN